MVRKLMWELFRLKMNASIPALAFGMGILNL
jgi:hypothetical protein